VIADDARPMTDAERRRLIRLLFGPRPTQPQK
jgi:hypothetical protein